jgi:hypothetical protein
VGRGGNVDELAGLEPGGMEVRVGQVHRHERGAAQLGGVGVTESIALMSTMASGQVWLMSEMTVIASSLTDGATVALDGADRLCGTP